MTTIDPSSSQDPASVSTPAPAAAPSLAAPAEAVEQPSPATTPFEWIGGESAVRTLVDRFYDLMDLEPEYKELRAAHGTTLTDARDKLFWFLCGWLGGPDHYIERFGHPRLRMRHMPFSIGIKERDQWVACMDQAMGETGVPEALRMRLRESFMGTADWMRNRGG
ncbi:group II truncated hemoglobin [Paracidovorax avenae]|uniref:group II truncated hemoglobin n=1 Tax=Paracidovorax avenae TaxID=80867 RepID=UPI001F400124|nr:group II truncated hemoglobin [Paracidovorax avenae]